MRGAKPLFENMNEASRLLVNALVCGLSYDDFYKMTFIEIDNYFSVYEEMKKDELKVKAKFDYNHAYLTGIAHHLKPPSVFPSLKKSYKGLFSENTDKAWETVKFKFAAYCDAYNEQRRRKA